MKRQLSGPPVHFLIIISERNILSQKVKCDNHQVPLKESHHCAREREEGSEDMFSQPYLQVTHKVSGHINHNRHIPFTNACMFSFWCFWNLHFFPKHTSFLINPACLLSTMFLRTSQTSCKVLGHRSTWLPSDVCLIVLSLGRALWSPYWDNIAARPSSSILPDSAFSLLPDPLLLTDLKLPPSRLHLP